tara:strand:+ start:192 stop:674 length:483 start_codon:yes stop_codon:yes gene_type:complete
MDKLLGDTEWIWDESDLPEGSDEDEYQYYADSQLSLLAEMSAELSSPGIMDNHWEYGIAMGYVGWMNSFGHTEVQEVDSVFLKYMVFDTLGDSSLTAKLDFTKVESGVITLTRSHHDRPMGETIYIFRCEEGEVLTEDEYREKLYDLGIKERPEEYKVVR